MKRKWTEGVARACVVVALLCSGASGGPDGGVWQYEEGVAAFKRAHYVEAVERLEGYLNWCERNPNEAEHRQDALIKASTCYLRLEPWGPWKPLEYARLVLEQCEGEQGSEGQVLAVRAFKKLTQVQFEEARIVFEELAESLASAASHGDGTENSILEAKLCAVVCKAMMIAKFKPEELFSDLDGILQATGGEGRPYGLVLYAGAMMGIYRSEWEEAERYLEGLQVLEDFDGKEAVAGAIEDLLGLDGRWRGLMRQRDNPIGAGLETLEGEAKRLLELRYGVGGEKEEGRSEEG